MKSDQREVFKTNNENSKEIIFALPLDENYVTDWNAFDIHMQTLQPANQATYNLKSAPWGGICATPQAISSYDPDDARLKNNWIQGQQYAASGQALNSTMGATSGKPLAFVNELPGIDKSDEVHGFRLGKFEFKMEANVQLSNDWPLFRYADIKMMKAECLLRTGKSRRGGYPRHRSACTGSLKPILPKLPLPARNSWAAAYMIMACATTSPPPTRAVLISNMAGSSMSWAGNLTRKPAGGRTSSGLECLQKILVVTFPQWRLPETLPHTTYRDE